MTLLKVKDAARLLNVSPAQVYAFLSQGMPHVRFQERCIRFKPEQIDAWIDKCLSTKTAGGDIPSSSVRGASEFTAFALRTRPKPKQKSGKSVSEVKSSGLTNLADYRSTASNKE